MIHTHTHCSHKRFETSLLTHTGLLWADNPDVLQHAGLSDMSFPSQCSISKKVARTRCDTCSHFPVLIRSSVRCLRYPWCDGQLVLFLWNMLHKLELFLPIRHGNHDSGGGGSNLSPMTTFELSGHKLEKNDLRWRSAAPVGSDTGFSSVLSSVSHLPLRSAATY